MPAPSDNVSMREDHTIVDVLLTLYKALMVISSSVWVRIVSGSVKISLECCSVFGSYMIHI